MHMTSAAFYYDGQSDDEEFSPTTKKNTDENSDGSDPVIDPDEENKDSEAVIGLDEDGSNKHMTSSIYNNLNQMAVGRYLKENFDKFTDKDDQECLSKTQCEQLVVAFLKSEDSGSIKLSFNRDFFSKLWFLRGLENDSKMNQDQTYYLVTSYINSLADIEADISSETEQITRIEDQSNRSDSYFNDISPIKVVTQLKEELNVKAS